LTNLIFSGGNPAYTKDGSGRVHLASGTIAISGDPFNQAVVTLPSGFLPSFSQYLLGFGNVSGSYVGVPFFLNHTNGELVYVGGTPTATQIFLNGLSWPTGTQTVSPYMAPTSGAPQPRADDSSPPTFPVEVVEFPAVLPSDVEQWVPPDVPPPEGLT